MISFALLHLAKHAKTLIPSLWGPLVILFFGRLILKNLGVLYGSRIEDLLEVVGGRSKTLIVLQSLSCLSLLQQNVVGNIITR